MKNVVQFSGGKDSTAMLLLWLERGVTAKAKVLTSAGYMNVSGVWAVGVARYSGWTLCGHCDAIIRNFGRNFYGWMPKHHILF